MKSSIYLEEALKDVLSTSNFVHGMFNLITAPCGSGKTTAAINVISKLASTFAKMIHIPHWRYDIGEHCAASPFPCGNGRFSFDHAFYIFSSLASCLSCNQEVAAKK